MAWDYGRDRVLIGLRFPQVGSNIFPQNAHIIIILCCND